MSTENKAVDPEVKPEAEENPDGFKRATRSFAQVGFGLNAKSAEPKVNAPKSSLEKSSDLRKGMFKKTSK